MKKLAIVALASVIGLSAFTTSEAEAKNGRNAAIAAGVLGAVVGGLIVSQAQAAPAYGYGYQPHGYRHAPVRYRYVEETPVEYRRVRRVRQYDEYGYRRPVVVRKTIIEKRYEPAPSHYGAFDPGW